MHESKASSKFRIIVNDHRCVQCGWCVSYCKHGAIHKMKEGKIIFLSEYCIGCKSCQEVCPRKAISYHYVSD